MRLQSRLRWFLGLFIPIVLAALVAGIIFGLQAAVSVVAFAGALAGALAGLARLIEGGEETEASPKPVLGRLRRGQIAVTAAFAIGALAGFVIPRVTNYLFPAGPMLGVRAPASVDKVDRVEVRWRHLPSAHEIWLLVPRPGERTYYPQTFHLTPQFDGSTECEVQVGRSDQAGEVFEIIPVLAIGGAGKELEMHLLDGTEGLPSGLITYPAVLTRRK